tara:strand:+ start:12 stop:530 length:519 start_codon:yes stop_codon:yes gene_type:complete
MPARFLISSQTLTSNAASVTFSSIPATYTDLVLRASIRTDVAAVSELLNFSYNGNVSSVYSYTFLTGSGSAAASGSGLNESIGYASITNGNSGTSNTFGSYEMYMPSYTASQNKPHSINAVSENNATLALIRPVAGLFRSTSAITSINIYPNSQGNFLTGSSFYLYGISKTN